MLFSQQQGIPVDIFHGALGAGATPIALNANYDHLFTLIHLKNASGAPQTVSLEDQGGNFVMEFDLATGETLTLNPELVLQSQTQIVINVAGGTCGVTISAIRLAPSAAAIFA